RARRSAARSSHSSPTGAPPAASTPSRRIHESGDRVRRRDGGAGRDPRRARPRRPRRGRARRSGAAGERADQALSRAYRARTVGRRPNRQRPRVVRGVGGRRGERRDRSRGRRPAVSDGYPGLPDERMTLGLGRPHADDGRAAGVTSPIGPTDAVAVFADLGAYGIDVGDDDLVAPGASSGERAAVVARFTRALDTAGIVVPAVTADLSSHPAFADGAFTAAEPTVRRAALRKAIDAIDLGAELGAELVVLDGGAELATNEAAKDVPTALDCYSEAVKACCAYVEDRGY